MDLTKYPMDRQVCTLQLESCEYLAPNHPSFVSMNINITIIPVIRVVSICRLGRGHPCPAIRPPVLICWCVCSGGYNLQDVVFYWTRGNDSVRGLDTLRLAQYSVESYHTTVSEAVYETGRYLIPEFPLHVGRQEDRDMVTLSLSVGKYPKLVLHFALRRNVLFFILETYVPSTLLVVLSWVSFWISQSSVPARTCIGQSSYEDLFVSIWTAIIPPVLL